jgi:hypothetical protein
MSVDRLASLSEDWLAAEEREALPLAIMAVKELLRDGLVRIGDTTTSGFVPWDGSEEEIESRIDSAAANSEFPLLPGHLFWLENTPLGDEKARQP